MGGKYLSTCFRKAVLYECALIASRGSSASPISLSSEISGTSSAMLPPHFFFLSLFVREGFYSVVRKRDP